jgi:hypothetical protein
VDAWDPAPVRIDQLMNFAWKWLMSSRSSTSSSRQAAIVLVEYLRRP